MGPKKTLFLDEISTGLDSSTTFQITRTLREFSHLRAATMLVALLQPTPETYDLFDDIMLLSEGTAPLLTHISQCGQRQCDWSFMKGEALLVLPLEHGCAHHCLVFKDFTVWLRLWSCTCVWHMFLGWVLDRQQRFATPQLAALNVLPQVNLEDNNTRWVLRFWSVKACC